jgi:hypothetical protein
MVLLPLFEFKIFAQPTEDNSIDLEDALISWQKVWAYPIKKGRYKFRRPSKAF